MSGSSRRTSRSRLPRHSNDFDIAVTEASFQSLGLHPSAGSSQYSNQLSAYQASSSQHRRPSYTALDPATTYLQPTYESSNFAVGSSPNPQLRSSTSIYQTPIVPSQPTAMSGPEMRYQLRTPSTTKGIKCSQFLYLHAADVKQLRRTLLQFHVR